MGKSITPTYRVEMYDRGVWEKFSWNSKQCGKPTEENLRKHREFFNKSFKQGGVNYPLSQMENRLIHYGSARIIHQQTGKVVAFYKAPLFEEI